MAFLSVDVKDYIATVTYSNPPANTTTVESYLAIRDTFHAIDQRDDIKVVVFTGAGKIFVAGNDAGAFEPFYERGAAAHMYDTIRNAKMAIKNCKYPTIGAINGAAVGAGFSFAACCDMLVAVEGAKFMLSEIKVGLIGADGFASMLVPEKVLRYLALSGNPVTAEQIAGWGGIHKVVPREKLMDTAYDLAKELASNSRRSLMLWKKCLNMNYDHDLARKFDNNMQCTVEFQAYEDFYEASKAFLEKRDPVYNNK